MSAESFFKSHKASIIYDKITKKHFAQELSGSSDEMCEIRFLQRCVYLVENGIGSYNEVINLDPSEFVKIEKVLRFRDDVRRSLEEAYSNEIIEKSKRTKR